MKTRKEVIIQTILAIIGYVVTMYFCEASLLIFFKGSPLIFAYYFMLSVGYDIWIIFSVGLKYIKPDEKYPKAYEDKIQIILEKTSLIEDIEDLDEDYLNAIKQILILDMLQLSERYNILETESWTVREVVEYVLDDSEPLGIKHLPSIERKVKKLEAIQEEIGDEAYKVSYDLFEKITLYRIGLILNKITKSGKPIPEPLKKILNRVTQDDCGNLVESYFDEIMTDYLGDKDRIKKDNVQESFNQLRNILKLD